MLSCLSVDLCASFGLMGTFLGSSTIWWHGVCCRAPLGPSRAIPQPSLLYVSGTPGMDHLGNLLTPWVRQGDSSQVPSVHDLQI